MRSNDDVMENQTPVEPVVTPQVVVEQPKSNSFLVILLSTLLFISVLIAGFFAYQTQKLVAELTNYKEQLNQIPEPTSTPDPTANWKTYTNTYFKYSFGYPQNWNLELFPGTEIDVETAATFKVDGPYDKVNPPQGDPAYLITVESSSKKTDTSSADKLIAYKQLGPNKYIKFSMTISDSNIKTFDTEVFNQILSTFKFTDSDPTADWKTYTNTKFKYSFKYPSSWTVLHEDVYEYSNVEIGTKEDQRIGAFHFTGKPEGDKESHTRSFQISNQNEYIMITFSRCPGGPGIDCGGAQSDADKKLFSQILSTFKFIN